MINRLKNLIQTVRRGYLFPTSKGGWPLISWEQHKGTSRVWRNFLTGYQQFGRNTLYQSFEPLGLVGLRDTKTRLEGYQLDELLKPNSRVLDIGSNMGCSSLTLALSGHCVIGVEFNQRLVDIANDLKSQVGAENAVYVHADFSTWEDAETYDAVLALAVHRWVPMEFDSFVAKVSGLTKDGGIFVFESNDYNVLGKDFEEEISVLEKAGFSQLHSGFLSDDGYRKFVVFRFAANLHVDSFVD